MYPSRLIILFLLSTLNCVAQNQFSKSTRWALSFEVRGYYDSAQYNLFKLGQAKAVDINLEVQRNLTPKLSWNNELQIIKFYPNKKERDVLDVAGIATKIKGYLYANNETYEGNCQLFNPYAQYGFEFTNIITEPSKQFVSMVASVGTEMNLYRLKRGFMQVNYSLGYGSKALNYLSFQYGVSYNFEEKSREVEFYKNRETEYALNKIKTEFEKYRIKWLQDSIENAVKIRNVNTDIQKSQLLVDSLINKSNYLTNELINCTSDFKWAKDSLDSANQILRSIYIKQWQNFEWLQQDAAIKSKNGFFAVAIQTFDLKVIESKRTESNLTFPYAIIKNKYNAYRLLYFIGNSMNDSFDENFSLVLEHFPMAEIVKLEDF